jgi:hypothetical protein
MLLFHQQQCIGTGGGHFEQRKLLVTNTTVGQQLSASFFKDIG